MNKVRYASIGKVLEKCAANGLDTEKAITEISAKDFYKLSQVMTRPEADLFFELQEAIQSKTLFAFFMKD